MTFREYLKTVKNDGSPEGDLATDLLNDKALKGRKLSEKMLRGYLERFKFRNPQILEFLDNLASDYQDTRILCAGESNHRRVRSPGSPVRCRG
jgi:hypothetical protein